MEYPPYTRSNREYPASPTGKLPIAYYAATLVFSLSCIKETLATKPFEPFPEEQASLDAMISSHDIIIRDLKTRRNGLTWICRLPPEILSHIFSFLPNSQQGNSMHYLKWVQLSHVCQHWRAVALGCPALWTHLTFSVFQKADCVSEMLARSKSTELSIDANLSYHTKPIDPIENALGHLDRVKYINIAAMPATLTKLFGTLESAAPKLRALTMQSSISSHLYSSSFSSGFRLPVTFLRGGTPKLTKLELLNCPILWNEGIPEMFKSNLTVLKLHGVRYTNPHGTMIHFPPTLEQLLDILGYMPSIQSLDLEDTLPTACGNTEGLRFHDRIVALPELKRLRLKSSTLDCADFLGTLVIPSTCLMSITCAPSKYVRKEIDAFMHALTKARRVSKTELRALSISYSQHYSIRFQFSDTSPVNPEVWTYHETPADFTNDLTFQANEYQVESATRALLNSVCGGLHLDELEFLRVYQISAVAKQEWEQHFGKLEKLKRIRVAGTSAPGLLQAMVPRTQVGTRKEVQADMSFAALRHLVLAAVDFDDEYVTDTGVTAEVLMDTLMLRASYGSEMKELEIDTASRFYEADEKKLEDVVVKLRWDGCIHDVDDDDESMSYDEDMTYGLDFEDSDEYDDYGGFPFSFDGGYF